MLQLKAGVWGFEDFLRNGLVEYLDVNEEDNALIALYEENIGLSFSALQSALSICISICNAHVRPASVSHQLCLSWDNVQPCLTCLQHAAKLAFLEP